MILVGRRLDCDEVRRLLTDPSMTHELLDEDTALPALRSSATAVSVGQPGAVYGPVIVR
jgi:hypothetical protein